MKQATLCSTLLVGLCMAGCTPKPPLHGTAFLIAIDTNANTANLDTAQALSRARAVLKKRLVKLGIQAFFQEQGDGRLLIQAPEVKGDDKDVVRQTLARPGMLTFRLVHPASDDLISKGVMEPEYEFLTRKDHMLNGTDRIEQVLVSKHVEMTGSSIKSALAVRDNGGEPQIDFELTSDGAAQFAKLTRDNIGRRLAIILDGKLYSAPVIRTAIEGGRGQISGNFQPAEAQDIARVLENPLDVPLRLLEEKSF
jgi:SecD/SecF fusion protein